MDLLRGNTNKALVSMSLPISIGMLSTILFQVIDTYFVGKLGAEQLVALGFASTVYFLLIGFFIGLSVAVSILVGKTFGEQDMTKVKQIIGLSLLISFSVPALFSALGIISIDAVFGAMGADASILPHIQAYMYPLYLGMPVLAVGIVGGAALRATGNISAPEIVFGIAGIINAVLDYVLIFGVGPFPELGIQGVAYGTVASWVFILLAIIGLMLKDKLLKIQAFSGVFKQVKMLKELYQLGLPSIATQLVGPATLMFITFLLGRETSTAVAAFGVAGRIETLLMVGVMAVSTAATPFIAQNLGAKQKLRIDEAIVFGGKASTYLGILLFILLMIFVKPISHLFSDDAEVVGFTQTYFYIVSISYVFYSLYLISSSIFNGLQLPFNSLKIILVKTLVFTVPLCLLGSLWGVAGIFVGLALSNVLGGLYAGRQVRAQLKKDNSSLLDKNPWQDYKQDIVALGRMLASVVKR